MKEAAMNEWLTTTQAGNELGLTGRRVRQLVKAGVLAGFLLAPRVMLVSRDSVHREAQRRKTRQAGKEKRNGPNS